MTRQTDRPLRVVHTPKNPSGLAVHLASAERTHGVDASVITTLSDFTDRSVDVCHELQERSGLSYAVGHVQALRSLPPADVVNLWYGATFVHWPRFGVSLADLSYLANRSTIVATYVGSDARRMLQRGGVMQAAAEASLGGRYPAAHLRWLDRMQRRQIERMADTAGQLFAVNPDLLRDLPADKTTFLPYPVEIEAPSVPHQEDAAAGTGPLRVLHAPTNPALKGTDAIEAAIERIQRDLPGRLEYRRLSGVDHATFVNEVATVDVFIDQLLIGWYGVSAVEAMLTRKAVVCCIDDDDLSVIDPDMAEAMPIIRADPSSIEAVLRRLITDRDEVTEAAAAGPRYAKRWHAPGPIAATTVAAYKDLTG